MNHGGADYLLISPETVDEPALAALSGHGGAAQLVLSQHRLHSLGMKAAEPGVIPLDDLDIAHIVAAGFAG